MPLKIEVEKPATTTVIDPAAPPADQKPPAKGKEDVSALSEFVDEFVGSRYKDIAAPEQPKGDDKGGSPERGPDGKFLKAGEKAKEKPAPPPPAKPKAKPVPFKPKGPAAPAPVLTAEQIAAAAAEGTARAMKADKPKDDAPAAKTKEPVLPPTDQRKVAILNRMAELYPDKYKGIGDKYAQSVLALEAYAKKWQAEHPGQDFDEESPEHEAFFKDNDVDWDDLDFSEAIADIRAEVRSKEATSKTDERLSELDRAEQLRAKQADIMAEQNTAAQAYWRALGEELADFIKPDGTLNMEKVQELQTSDPEGLSIRVAAAKSLDAEVAELYKLFNGLAKNDIKNPVHANLNRFVVTKEQELSSKSPQEKFNANGQSFLPAAEYYPLSKAEKENHWTFSAKDIAFMRAADLAAQTNERVRLAEERHIAWAKARGIKLDDSDAKPESPSAGGESRLAAAAAQGGKNSPSNGIPVAADVM